MYEFAEDEFSYMPKFYVMDPEVDDLIEGYSLEEDMVVLIEDSAYRLDMRKPEFHNEDWKITCADLNNLWCRITNLKITPYGSMNVHFIGVYADGTKRTRTVSVGENWIVKKASIPAKGTVDEIKVDRQKGAAILDQIKLAMRKQDAATYHGGGPRADAEMADIATRVMNNILDIVEGKTPKEIS